VKAPAAARLRPTVPLAAACAGLSLANWLSVPGLLGGALLLAAAAGIALLEGAGRLAALGAACAVAGLWFGSLRLDALDRSLLEPEVGSAAQVVVAITGPPRRSTFNQRLPAEVRLLDGRPLRERTMLELPLARSPPQGALIELRVRVRAPRGPDRGFDERGWLARRGVHVVLRGGDDWRIVGRRGGLGALADRLRRHLDRSIAPGLSGERRAVVAGVVLGEDEGLSDELQDDFRASGLYHLLAVSGQNVLYIALGVAGLGWLLRMPRLGVELAVLAAIAGYVLAVGWQPSVVRAGVAGALASLAWLAARPSDRWHFLASGALVLLAWTPATLLEPGFQLSFAAVASIFLAVPRIQGVLEGYPVPHRLADVVALSLVCGLATAPIAWLHFGAVPLYTVPANALAAPVMGPLLGLGLIAAALEPVVPPAAVALAWTNGWLAAYLAWCARLVAGLPFAQLTSGWTLIALGAAVLAAFALRRMNLGARLAAIATAGLLLLAGIGLLLRRPAELSAPVGLRVVFLDVGQGDAALLQVPEGNVLVDQGPPEARVGRQLRRLGVRRLAALVLTHPQRDHVGGAAEVLRRLRVDTVLDPGLPSDSPDEAAALAEARRRSVPITFVRRGAAYRLGRLQLRVLWPVERGLPDADPNDYAVVLLASYGATDVLLPADAESNVTARLRTGPVEVLKVAHHGSADPGLADELDELRPRVAIVSVGRGNDYGHPRAGTLAALRAVPGIALYRTDEDGRIVLESDGRRLRVTSER
jgi:competence protein ComEC